jgi:uncharacterized membrane protein
MQHDPRAEARATTYPLLKFVHLVGLTLMGAGLIGVWYADLRSRQVRDLPLLAEAIRTIAMLYDGLVVPGALLLLGSGIWLIVTTYGAGRSSACRGSRGWSPCSPSSSSKATP